MIESQILTVCSGKTLPRHEPSSSAGHRHPGSRDPAPLTRDRRAEAQPSWPSECMGLFLAAASTGALLRHA